MSIASVRLYTLALLAVLIYGATPVFTKIATGSADGITVGALRAVVAGPVAAAIILAGGYRIPWRAHDIFLVVVSGLGGLVLVVSDTNNHRLRRIRLLANGDVEVTTLAGRYGLPPAPGFAGQLESFVVF